MKIAFFNTKQYDQEYFDRANQNAAQQIRYFSSHLNLESTSLITDEKVVCAFINDNLNAEVLHKLKSKGIELIALRSAGFNHVDVACAKQLSLPVVRVPAYSPFAVAEHAVGLLLCLNRGIHRAHNRIREGDFSLRNLMGFDIHGKTVGIIGTGKIGQAFANIMLGFGCKVIAYDVVHNEQCIKSGVTYVSLDNLLSHADVISLHCPLTPETYHLINQEALAKMRDGVTIINTSRGKLVDTKAIINSLKNGKVGLLGLDVYEEEEALFFEDFSKKGIQDDVLARLTTFPNVIITSHQGFFTQEAMLNIAQTTLSNISQFEQNGSIQNGVI
ncbi:2-hydroxyacid dehydrogenase [Paraglaciecola arctica]|uniref:D-lactate dehydrogenase n=1 Tax=Paraglaciecola arctica BSs20135 TaxID=493475 RepID=K6YZ50_9ALTE|nr:2-hydroxyacid dehydrogenase [Paraglaciecola arctica]GAC22033.1 D-lactate dehydrogenase [Paraglaciecola arctica BSs20135]